MEKEEINDALMKKYKLSKEEHEKIYQKLEQDVFRGKKPVDSPVCFIVGGQPGSGKSGLISYSEKFFKDENVVVISVDDYKKYHPMENEIMIQYPTLYTTLISQETTDWTARILGKAIEEKYNFIFEITLKDNKVLETLERLKEKGYTICVRTIAVPKLESLMSIHERYERELEKGNRMRLARIIRHNIAYENMPQVVEQIEKSKTWQILEVYIRGNQINQPKLIYKNDRKEGKKTGQYNAAKEAIEENRKMTKEEYQEIKKRFTLLKEKFMARKMTKEEAEQLKELETIIESNTFI